MDAEFWIYLIIGVIFFVSRLLKSNVLPGEQTPGEGSERTSRERAQPGRQAPRPLTFEELLREITEGKKAAQPAANDAFGTDADEEGQSLERIPDEESNRRVFAAYEEAKRRAAEPTSLEETLKLKDTPVEFGKFEVFETQEKPKLLNDYINIIRNPETLRQAVVMSEVLKRKF